MNNSKTQYQKARDREKRMVHESSIAIDAINLICRINGIEEGGELDSEEIRAVAITAIRIRDKEWNRIIEDLEHDRDTWKARYEALAVGLGFKG